MAPIRRTASLGGKTFAIVVVATLALVAICLPLRSLVIGRFAAIEAELGQRDLDRVRHTLADRVAALRAMARDYAVWDETFAFVGGEDPGYVERNFADTTFAENGIGLVLVLDAAGEKVFSQGFDLAAGARRAAPSREVLVPTDDDVLLVRRAGDGSSEGVSGLGPTPEGPYLVGAHSILTSEHRGPSRGTLLLGRALDAREVQHLAETLRVDLAIAPYGGPYPHADIEPALRALGGSTSRIAPIDADTLGGYAVIEDVRGEPCVVIRIATPRTVYAQGVADANAIAAAVAVASLLFGLLVLALLQGVVIRRVTRLGEEVSIVGGAADHSLRVTVRGEDELGKLAGDVNAMLSSLEKLNTLLDAERAKAERLLRNILPASIAERLKDKHETIADSFPEVSVLFADIVGFTGLSSKVSAEELVVMLNEIFSRFDALAEEHGLEKIKTIGDAYMIVAGLPDPRPDHAEALARMALDMQAALDAFNAAHGTELAIRIGINTGPVVAGVIGTKKFIYDLWGDAVNIASRMESSGVPGRVQVSESTHDKLRGKLEMEPRGAIEVKGKGEMRTWLLVPSAPPRRVSATLGA
jgi:adenylate cyclase